MKRKVCVVVTARASYSRIKTALQSIAAHPDLELTLVVGASALLDRYGNALKFIRQDGFEIAGQAYMVLEGDNPVTSAKTTGMGIIELAGIFDNVKVDVVVTVGDRYETLASSVAASYMNIPLVHVQGGEVTGSIDEKVRHAVTKLANLHFVATKKAAERVIRMGESPDTVFVTGCPSIDLAAKVLKDGTLDFDPFEKYGGVGPELDISQGYIVVVQHPVATEYERSRQQVEETLYSIHHLGIPALWFWPNVDAGSDETSGGIRAFRETRHNANIYFFKNMSPEDFLKLVYNSRCIVGNSSVAIRECSFLGVPSVNIGTRQKGRERGQNVVDVDYNRLEITHAIEYQLSHGPYSSITLYGNGHAGEAIAQLLAQQPLKVEKELAY